MNDTQLTETRIQTRNISMYPEQWNVIDEVNDRFGFRNVSSALRFIINEYRQIKSTELAEPSNTTAAGATAAQ